MASVILQNPLPKKKLLRYALASSENSHQISIPQTASFYDTNWGERPNLTACTERYLLRAVNQHVNVEGYKPHAVLNLYRANKASSKLFSLPINVAVDTLFPISYNIFGACTESDIDFYRVDPIKESICKIHHFRAKDKLGFQGEPPLIISSF